MTRIIVFKVGGALLDNQDAASKFLSALGQLKQSVKVVLVHGGGSGVDSLLTQLNIVSQKHQGLRISPAEHMPYVTGALAGTANKQLAAIAYSQGIETIGLSLFDGNSVSCQHTDPLLGSVGTPQANDPKLLLALLAANYLPIISSIGCSAEGDLLNVNADQAATAIAQLLNADLYLLSDVLGVLDAERQLLHELTGEQIQRLTEAGTIRDGMLVKVAAAKFAADSIQRPVIIGSWANTETLIDNINLLPEAAFGTRIMPTAKEK